MITANELKTKGVGVIKDSLETSDSVGISVRGQMKYVVLTIEEFDRLKEVELDFAIIESQNDIKAKNYTTSLEDHFEELKSSSIAAEDAEDYP